jgi:DNA-binding CsgD family transcriptional regulator
MPLRLLDTELKALSTAMTIMLTPFCFPDGEQWRGAICNALNPLVGASGSTLELVVPGEPIIGGCPDLARTLETLLPPPDWMLKALEKRRRLGLNVAGFADIYDVDVVKRSPFYNDVVIPNRLLEPIDLIADFDGAPMPAVLGFVFEDEHAALKKLERNKQMLSLVVPAFVAGVTSYVRMARVRAGFASLVDSLDVGATIVALDGKVLDENQAMKALVDVDPERTRIRALVKQSSLAIATIVARGKSPDWTKQSRPVEVRTALGKYRISAIFVPDGFLNAQGAVVAFTERLPSTAIDSQALTTRFGLTSREIQTAQLVSRGYSTRQIATEMGISFNTARRHTEHVLLKLNMHSRSAIAAKLTGVS